MRGTTILQVREQRAPHVVDADVGALVLHLAQNTLVHLYFVFVSGLLQRFNLFLGRLVVLEPRVLLDLLQAVAQAWLGHENLLDEVLDVLRQHAREVVLGVQDLLVEALRVLILEG